MFNLLSQYNYNSYNITLASVLGLYSAVYLSLLINENLTKKEEYISISRKKISAITGLNELEQQSAEENLISYSLINVKKSNNLRITLNEELILQLLTDPHLQLTQKVQKSPKTKKERIAEGLKNLITVPDDLCVQYLGDWIDVCVQKYGLLSKTAIKDVCTQVLDIANGDLTLLRSMCKEIAALGYKNYNYALEKYTKTDLKHLNNLSQECINNNIDSLKNYGGELF